MIVDTMENILITGGTGNLGKTVVKVLSDTGYHLHLAVRNPIMTSSESIFQYQADLTDSRQAETFLQKATSEGRRINVGIFLAGGFEPGNLAATEMDDINKMININFATAFNLAQKLITYFKTVGGGKLIFIGAKSAMDFKTAGNSLAYSLSKQLLFNFSDIINQSEHGSGITSHILLPGAIGNATPGTPGSSKLTSPDAIAHVIEDIIEGKDLRSVVAF